jgi:ABC-2 type transport system ATP-binding protein
MYEQLVRSTPSDGDLVDPPFRPDNAVAGTTHSGVQAVGLGKRFGDLWALRHLDIDAAPGTVLGLLGHNGAGKTTAIRVLTTLSRPTEGHATVAGYDVERYPALVRSNIGVASQQATVDGLLDARLNLELIGRLHRLSKADARRRADELIERFGLTDAASRLVKTYSGGMRRRIDLAACLVATPQVLFLDEPTTGLDPRSREDLWDMLRELVADGTALILTTQYLEEADRLADDIVVLDHGRTVAHGSPAELKRQIGDDRIVVTVALADELALAASVLSRFATGDLTMDAHGLTVTASTTSDTRLVEVVRALDADGIYVADITRRQSTLDDVFLTLTAPEHS